MITVEYDHKKQMNVGYFSLLDKTRAIYRIPTKLLLTLMTYRSNNRREQCENNVVTLSTAENDKKITKVDNGYQLELSTTENVGNIKINLILDMAHIDLVYQKTHFITKIYIQSLEKNNEYSNQYDVEFIVTENTKRSFLVIDYKKMDQSTGDYYNYKWNEKDNISSEIRIEGDLVHRKQGKSTLIRLKLRNSATYPNADPPTNVVTISKITMNVERKDEDHIILIVQSKNDMFINENNKIDLSPNDCVFLIIKIDHVDADHIFKNPEHKGRIIIIYKQPMFDGTEMIEKELTIPFQFLTQSYLGEEIIAVDFGSSAISAAHTLKGSGDELIPMKKWWKKKHPLSAKDGEQDGAIETSEFLVSSILYTTKKNPHNYNIGIPFGLQPKFEIIPYLKSHIGACQKHLISGSGKSLSIADLVKYAYQDLHENYFLKQRNGQVYHRMVITHPNSYVSGQIDFLKDKIKKVSPKDILDIQTLSESDAVIYDYLENLPQYQPDFSLKKEMYNILCYDLGAGTLDISYRQITFKSITERGKTLYRPVYGKSAKLLNMLSVYGAGNEIDEIIATMIDSVFKNMIDLYEKGKRSLPDDDNQLFIPKLFELDIEKQQMQKNILMSIQESIKKSKKEFVKHKKELIIVIKKTISGDNAIEIPKKLLKRSAFDITIDNRKDELKIKFSSSQVINAMKNYIDKHVIKPLDVILKDKNNHKILPDIVIISGRGALFPGVYEALVIELNEISPGINIIFNQEEPEQLKTMVVNGALKWGKAAINNKPLFMTPYMHGVIGLALLDRHNKWNWQPLAESHILNEDIQNRSIKYSDLFYPDFLKQIFVLQTSIQSPTLVESYLERDIKNGFGRSGLEKQLAQHDYFNVIHSINNIDREFQNEQQSRISLTLVIPSDGSAYGKIDNEVGYLNMRVNIYITSPNSGAEHQVEFDIGAQQLLEVKNIWPNNVFL